MGVTATVAAEPALRPPAVRPGATIAVVATAGPTAARCPRRVRRAVDGLRRAGFDVRLGRTLALDDGSRAGSPQERADDVVDALLDDDGAAIGSAVGGAGSPEVAELLPTEVVRTHPKVWLGYSDFTSLLLHVWVHAGLVTFYGPAALAQFGEPGGCDPLTLGALRRVVGGAAPAGPLPPSAEVVVEHLEWDRADHRRRRDQRCGGRRCLRPGDATGTLVAANLSTLAELVRADAASVVPGALLLLEESDTASAGRFADNLRTLQRAGWFREAAGVGLGRLAQVERGAWRESDVDDLLLAEVDGDGPLATRLELGHTDPMWTVPIGVLGRLRAGAREVGVEVLEGAVAC